MRLQYNKYEGEDEASSESAPSYLRRNQKPKNGKFNSSVERKIERACVEAKKLGWDYNDFAAYLMEVLIILREREKVKSLRAKK